MIELEDALASYASQLPALPIETIATTDSLDRRLAQDLKAMTDLPRFDQSAMDGYAFAAADTASASSEAPLRLPLAAYVAAGPYRQLAALQAATVARVFTGAPMPTGADTVLAQEFAERDGDALVLRAPQTAGTNIRYRGEELRRGATVARRGQRVTPGLLSSLVNADVEQLPVHRRARIHLLISGDEVRPAGQALQPGEIHDSNAPLVTAILQRWGYPPPTLGYVTDDLETVQNRLAAALDQADLVLTAGGASVGDRDYLPQAAERLGVQGVFAKVAQKPGKPMHFGVHKTPAGRCALLSMPGNPGAVLISMALHARRILDCLEGAAAPGPLWHSGRLTAAVERDVRRARLLRMQLEFDAAGTACLTELPQQDSHMLSNLAAADVLVWIHAGTEPLRKGALVSWTRLP